MRAILFGAVFAIVLAVVACEELGLSPKDVTTISTCQEVGRACKDAGDSECYAKYDACMRDGGMR